MKVLLDTCVWGGVRAILEDAGHETEWVGEWPTDPGDASILDWARRHGSAIVTLDKDFGELAVLHGLPHSGIVRLVNLAARRQGPVCRYVLSTYEAELQTGAIVTVEPGRVRIRPPDRPAHDAQS